MTPFGFFGPAGSFEPEGVVPEGDAPPEDAVEVLELDVPQLWWVPESELLPESTESMYMTCFSAKYKHRNVRRLIKALISPNVNARLSENRD